MDILGLFDLPNWLLIIILLFLAYYIHGTWHFGTFKGSGVTGPTPGLAVGTAGPGFKRGFHVWDCEVMEKYGETVAMFDGRLPSMYTMDEDIIKEVMVKQFQNFTNHRVSMDAGEPINLLLTVVQDDHWKRLRTLLSPTFSTGKIKRMSQQVNRTSQILVDNLQEHEKNKTSFDVKEYIGAFTMDTIASTAFSLDINSQADLDNPFVTKAKKLTSMSLRNPLVILMILFPFVAKYLMKMGVSLFPKDVYKFFAGVVENAMEDRKSDTTEDKKQVDFLQLMMNAHKDNETENDVTDPVINEGNKQDQSAKQGLTHKELLANSFLFFLAGYDTTATGMTYLLYNLAVYPDVQEKLYQEVMQKVGDKEYVDYSVLNELTYMDQCINESLRLFPPVFRTDRHCKKDVTIKGIHIKKGTAVVVPVYAMHHSPRYWEDPEAFKPERFAESTEQNYHYMPFGQGPRNCIGMRLALMEIKVAVIKLLQKYRLVKTEETEFPVKFSIKQVMRPEKPIKIGLASRP